MPKQIWTECFINQTRYNPGKQDVAIKVFTRQDDQRDVVLRDGAGVDGFGRMQIHQQACFERRSARSQPGDDSRC